MRTGAGNVVTLLRLLPTPSGPSPMHMDGIPSVSFPDTYPMHPLVSSFEAVSSVQIRMALHAPQYFLESC